MDIVVRVGGVLTPFFFAVFASASLVGVALLFAIGRIAGSRTDEPPEKLSNAGAVEYRAAGYLVLAFGWSVLGLLLAIVGTASAYESPLHAILVVLSLLSFLFVLCFLYAGMAVVLGAATGQASEDGRWFFPALWWLDGAIVRFGDALFGLLMGRTGGGGRKLHMRRPGSPGRFHVPGVSRRDEATRIAEEMQRLRDRLTAYEARLSPEQAEQLRRARKIVEELKSYAP